MSQPATLLDILSIPHIAAMIVSMATIQAIDATNPYDTLRSLSRDCYATLAWRFFQNRRLNTAIPLYMLTGRDNDTELTALGPSDLSSVSWAFILIV
jgi:hypothetical protein